MQNLSLGKACFVIIKARAFDAKGGSAETRHSVGPGEDDTPDVLDLHRDDPIFEELQGALIELNRDEMAELIALAWLGRGDFAVEDWADALAEAQNHVGNHPVRYLVGMPMLGDYLEEGLSTLGYSCEEFELNRM